MRGLVVRPHARDGGFTLLEILVALAILTLVLATAQQAFSGSLQNIRASDEYTRAVAIARSRLNALLADPQTQVGTVEERMSEGAQGLPGSWEWRATVEVHEEEALEHPTGLGRRPRFIPLKVDVEVTWEKRSVSLSGLRLAPTRQRRR
ncbi:MAG: type II secretion system minor pseudopilin GspI [Gammaproteobacteria bacterium]